MATPLDILRSQDPNLYLVNDQELTDQLWEQYQDRYPDKEIFTQFLKTEEGLFDKTKLQPIQPTLESGDQELRQEGDRKPASEWYKDKAYYDNLLETFKKSFFDTTALGVKGASAVSSFFEMDPEDQKVLIKNDWVREKLGGAGLLDKQGMLDLSWLPSEPHNISYLRKKSTDILENPQSYSDDRIQWAENAQNIVKDYEESRVPIEERGLYKKGEA